MWSLAARPPPSRSAGFGRAATAATFAVDRSVGRRRSHAACRAWRRRVARKQVTKTTNERMAQSNRVGWVRKWGTSERTADVTYVSYALQQDIDQFIKRGDRRAHPPAKYIDWSRWRGVSEKPNPLEAADSPLGNLDLFVLPGQCTHTRGRRCCC